MGEFKCFQFSSNLIADSGSRQRDVTFHRMKYMQSHNPKLWFKRGKQDTKIQMYQCFHSWDWLPVVLNLVFDKTKVISFSEANKFIHEISKKENSLGKY